MNNQNMRVFTRVFFCVCENSVKDDLFRFSCMLIYTQLGE